MGGDEVRSFKTWWMESGSRNNLCHAEDWAALGYYAGAREYLGLASNPTDCESLDKEHFDPRIKTLMPPDDGTHD